MTFICGHEVLYKRHATGIMIMGTLHDGCVEKIGSGGALGRLRRTSF